MSDFFFSNFERFLWDPKLAPAGLVVGLVILFPLAIVLPRGRRGPRWTSVLIVFAALSALVALLAVFLLFGIRMDGEWYNNRAWWSCGCDRDVFLARVMAIAVTVSYVLLIVAVVVRQLVRGARGSGGGGTA